MKARDKVDSKIQTTITKFLLTDPEVESEIEERKGTFKPKKENNIKPIRLGARSRPLLAGPSRPTRGSWGQEGGKGARVGRRKVQGL